MNFLQHRETRHAASLLTSDKNWLRRLHPISSGKGSLIYCKAGTSAGVDVQQRLLERDVTEGLHEGHFDLAAANGHFNFVAMLVAEFQEIFGVDVRDQVAEGAVESYDFSGEAFLVQF